ncbi:MAG: class I SAM-dependent methyltransferase [Sedimentisphaerales bacterium]|nr:class I SAM-dependent methyltransferase [Sedimentisphaerales bacterium]
MTKKSKKEISREVGLEVGSICGKYFLKLDHLHYGYWNGGLDVDITNLHTAQDKYAEFAISHIPDGVKTILDVGCGTGQIAKMLIDAGYKVDCVSPSDYMNRHIRELLGDKSRIFECTYEEIETTNKYDMIWFCESFQYIDPEKALSNTIELLNDGGYLFICDIFRRDTKNKGLMGGGHDINKFHDLVEQTPFKLIENKDITEQTAPNMDLMNDILHNVVRPVVNAGMRLSESRYPMVVKFLKWKYRKKMDKLGNKYFSGGRSGEDFKKFKTYQLLLYQKQAL